MPAAESKFTLRPCFVQPRPAAHVRRAIMHMQGVQQALSLTGRCAGFPRNPHNRNHLTGGSSSGTAAAVASGLVPFGLGAP